VKHIVYLNPDPGARDSFAGVMRFEGFAVEAIDTEELVLASTRPLPDLVVLDAGSAGVEICRRLRALAPSVPILLLTPAGAGRTRASARRAGASAHLTAPATVEALLTTMSSLVSRSRSAERPG
jgi:two-component system OmpR family response regulator